MGSDQRRVESSEGDTVPASKDGIYVYRDAWAPEHMALLCGIANAGGGALVVASAASTRTRGIGRLRRPFEKIPELAQRELGIACTTYPVLDGPLVRLEISVPPSDPEHPTHLDGAYWFYDRSSERNLNLSLNGLKERRGELMGDVIAEQPSAKETTATSGSTSMQEIVQMFSDMASKLASMVDGASVEQSSNTFVIKFPQEDEARSLPVEGTPAGTEGAQGGVGRVGMRELDMEASEFSQRSIAAANKMNLTSTDEYVLRVLHTNGRATAPRIAELLGVSESTVRRSFKQLKTLGLIERVGSTKAGYWHTLD